MTQLGEAANYSQSNSPVGPGKSWGRSAEVTRQLEEHSIDTATGKAAPAEISESRVKTIFSRTARQYEQFNKAASLGQDHRWLDKLVDLLPITHKTRVLDVAAGTGEVSFNICDHKPPASIMLTDYTPAMLEMARQRIARGDNHGVPIETMVVDAQEMPFEDSSFDVVTMAYGIRNIPNRERALSEVLRVLVPGGTAIFLEFSKPKLALERAVYNLYLRYGVPAWGEYFTGNREDFEYLAQSIRAFPDQKTFASMLDDAGFSRVEYHNLTFGAVALHVAVR